MTKTGGPAATDETANGRFGGRRLTLAGVAACCVLSLSLHLVGIRWGLPFLYHADEPLNFSVMQHMLKNQDPNPHFFNYPSLFLYVGALFEAGYVGVCRALGTMHGFADLPELDVPIMGSGYTALPAAFLTLRLMSVVFGVATVIVAYRIGRLVSPGVRVGLVSALLVAVSPSVLADSRFITPEGLLTFVTTCSLWFALRALHSGRPSDYVLAAVLAGLAASVKYNGAVVGIGVCLAGVLRDRSRAVRNPWLYLAPVIAIASFVLTTPFAVLDHTAFWKAIVHEHKHYSTGHTGAEGNTLAFYASYLLSEEGLLALCFVPAAIAGVACRNARMTVLAGYCATYFAFINTFVVRNGRTIVPMVPTLLVLAAWLVCQGWLWLSSLAARKGAPGSLRVPIAFACVALLIAAPLRTSVAQSRELTWPDNRDFARVWVEANIPPHSRIAIQNYSCYVDRHRYRIKPLPDITKMRVSAIPRAGDYLILSAGEFTRFVLDPTHYARELAIYQGLFDSLPLLARFQNPHGGDEVRIYSTHPL